MPLPHLHIFHPPEERLPGVLEWLAELERQPRDRPVWDACVLHRQSYGGQADFHVGTAVERIRRARGPVILLESVQYKLFSRLQQILARDASVYLLRASCADDLLRQCEEAQAAFDAGEPLAPVREMIAYLILRKLARMDMWAGEALNKNFLWSRNLPKGGFPKGHVGPGAVMEVAAELLKVGLLVEKESDREMEYGLGPKALVQPIIDSKSFASFPQLRRFFDRSARNVSARLFDYNSG